MNSPDAVVVITYPGHCLCTIATIKNIFDLTSWEVPVYIYVDDQGEHWKRWELDSGDADYLDEFSRLIRKNFPFRRFVFHRFSDFGFDHIYDGWLRQQMVKLNLDRFTPGDVWYVTDGDVICERLLEATEVPFDFVPDINDSLNTQTRSYICYFLGTENSHLEYDGRPIYTHAIPCRWINSETLESLRFFVSKRLKNDFNLEHIRLMRSENLSAIGNADQHMSMTEWDLLEVYKHRVSNKRSIFKHWTNTDTSYPGHRSTRYHTFFGTDKDLGNAWFHDHGIRVDNRLWKKLENLHRA